MTIISQIDLNFVDAVNKYFMKMLGQNFISKTIYAKFDLDFISMNYPYIPFSEH